MEDIHSIEKSIKILKLSDTIISIKRSTTSQRCDKIKRINAKI
jgi:hypothetical protein